MTEESNALPVGYNLHRYQIQGVLGAGGFGITYQAVHEALENQAAIKEYFPVEWAYRDHNGITIRANAQGQMPARPGEPPCYQWGLERFLDEAKILVQINHPGVVRVRDYFTANGSAYIVMEYEVGESLSTTLQRGGILPEPELRRLLDDVMPALEAVHSANYMHRDLKPSNLYVRNRDGHVMLLDFGAARQALGRHTRSVTSVVTPGYSPIEQYVTVGEDYGPWTDIYALGAVMYRCITGAPPIEAPGRVLKDPVQPAVEVGAGLYSPGILQVVDQALAVRPEDRFQSVAAMRQALMAAERSDDGRADFSALPPISSNLLDLPSALSSASLRFDPQPPHAAVAPQAAAPAWSMEVLEPRPLAQDITAGEIATADDHDLPMLENIWENFDAIAPPAPPPATPDIGGATSAVAADLAPSQLAQGLGQDSASESLLGRSTQSAVEHLRKSASRRAGLHEALSSPHSAPVASAAAQPVDALVQRAAHELAEELPASATAADATPARRTGLLLGIILVAGLSGAGLLGYQYYQELAAQRAQSAAAAERAAEQARIEEQARKREAEINIYLTQARKALDERALDKARISLDLAAKVNPQHAEVQSLRAALAAAQHPSAHIKTQANAVGGFDLHWVEGACFNIGSPAHEADRSSDEAAKSVCNKGFWISKTEITNAQLRRFKPTHNSGSFQGYSLNNDEQPAVNLTWNDAQAFVEWLTWETGNGKRLRLPTEAEWEQAARAGTTTRYYWGNEIDPRYANFSDRNDPTGASIGNLDDGQAVTAPVGSYTPNALGLQDMTGNIWEWTCSEYQPKYGGEEQRCSAKKPNEGQRVTRGGSWNNGPGELRSAKRRPRAPNERDALTGFRVVMEE